MTQQLNFLVDPGLHETPSSSGGGQVGATSNGVEQASHSFGLMQPFVYTPAPVSMSETDPSPAKFFWNSLKGVVFASSPATSETAQHVFDSWITSLAHWTQAGSATIEPHYGNQFGDHPLASNGIDTRTHGGWN